ncbi:MAG: hypothetical protein AB7H96_10405 [Vicinamibacterales bacterium]
MAFEEPDEQLASRILLAWEREMAAFLSGQPVAWRCPASPSRHDLVRHSDPQLYANLKARRRRRRR